MRDLEVAVVFLQPGCGMRCQFCITEDGFDAMSFATAAELLRVLAARGVGCVTFGGGEPFAWPGDLIGLARHGQGLGLRVQVGTACVGLPEGFAALDCFDRFVLPIESLDAGVHNELRPYRGRHLELVLSVLSELGRARRSVTLSTVITAKNRHGLLDLAEFLRGYHSEFGTVHAWHLYQFLPLGRGGARYADSLLIPEADYRHCCELVLASDLPFRVFRRRDMYQSRSVGFFWSQAGEIVTDASPARNTFARRKHGSG